MVITKTRYAIKDSQLVEGINSFFSEKISGYTPDISKATLFESQTVAFETMVSPDEEVVEIEISYNIKDEITPIVSEYPELSEV